MTKDKCLKFTANTLALVLEWNGYSGWVIFLATIPESDVEQQVHLGDQHHEVVAYRKRFSMSDLVAGSMASGS
ncbi:hypothetical protein U0070_023999 [Myodes glareolus]|uniref:Uncharacterized protein n=1 Tax=Myodes glareolus TaxID=447135 RepID=A0AAW0I563_MYOGA